MRLVRPPVDTDVQIKLSEVMSALSFALDLVEGQPEGHSVRSCVIGMRVGRELGLGNEALSSLFYALLMKDLGCSSNAAKMCFLFQADDRYTKANVKTANMRRIPEALAFAFRHVAPGSPWLTRAKRLAGFAIKSQRAGKELIQIRCERGAAIARLFGLSEDTANAIHALDEHYDGGGHPDGLVGEQIPVLARVMGLAQTAEVFHREQGLSAMRDMARDRRGAWFDKHLTDILLAIPDADPLWRQLAENPRDLLHACEPEDRTLFADNDTLDNIARGFAQVIDAKSPWTFRHSVGVAEVAVGISNVMGFDTQSVRQIRRAALLHDIGKLGVSNLILDKAGKLTPEEYAEVKRHPGFTQKILQRVAGFSQLAELAGAHHERLDGKGYHRGLEADDITTPARILCVSDMYEALAARRPYRQDLTGEEVMTILNKNCPAGVCPEVLSALVTFLDHSGFHPEQVAA